MRKGQKVKWNYGKSYAEGVIRERFTKPVRRRLKNSWVKRNASLSEPAYLIEQKDGDKVLKSESELMPKRNK